MTKSLSTPTPAVPVRFESYTPEPRISYKKSPKLLAILALAGAFALGRYTKGDSDEAVKQQQENTAAANKRLESRMCILNLLEDTRKRGSSVSMSLLNEDLSKCESIVLARPEKKAERD